MTTIYSKSMAVQTNGELHRKTLWKECRVNVYDTVGLDDDDEVVENILKKIEKSIRNERRNLVSEDITIVWLCIDNKKEDLDSCELKLIERLAIGYKIPFIITLINDISGQEGGLEQQLRENLYSIPVQSVTLDRNEIGEKDIYISDAGKLLRLSISKYKEISYALKSEALEENMEEFIDRKNEDIESFRVEKYETISDYSSKAAKIGCIPVICIPCVYRMCIRMIKELENGREFTYRITFKEERVVNRIFGGLVAPLMFIPGLSSVIAKKYMEIVGEDHLRLLVDERWRLYLDEDKDKAESNRKIIKKLGRRLKKLA